MNSKKSNSIKGAVPTALFYALVYALDQMKAVMVR